MGSGRFDPGDWAGFTARTTRGRTREEIFTATTVKDEFNPAKIKVRESVDSKDNPNSTPIILGCDNTGSMGMLAETIIREGLGVIMGEIYDRKPVTDPHILCASIGDVECDHWPLSVTQFEADIRLAEQLKDLFIESGGGGNMHETYCHLWYFANNKTLCDAQRKRGRKGYLFTIGDECPQPVLRKSEVKKVFGDTIQADLPIKDLLDTTSQNWEVFHLIVKPVAHQQVVKTWTEILGQRAIQVRDHTKLGEVIVSTIQINEGADHDDVAASWSGDTSLVVADATRGLTKRSASAGVLRL